MRPRKVLVLLLLSVVLLQSRIACFGQPLLKLKVKVKQPQAVQFSQDNRFVAVGSGFVPQLFGASNETLVRSLDGIKNGLRAGHGGTVLCLGFSPDNQLLATGGNDRVIKLWNYLTGDLVGTMVGHKKSVIGLSFISADRLASISEDETLKIWDTRKGSILFSIDGHGTLRSVDVAPGGQLLAIAGADTVVSLINPETGELLRKLTGHSTWIRSLAFSPDGKYLASAADNGKVLVWNLSSYKVFSKYELKGWCYDLEFSPDARYLSIANEKNQVQFYDIETGIKALQLKGFDNAVRVGVFNPNGKEFVTIEEFEPYVKYWDVEGLNITPLFRSKDLKDINPPQIFVSSPAVSGSGKVQFTEELLRISGTTMDESGVRRLRINGMEAPLRSNGNFAVNLALSVGDNPVVIEATDINDNISVKRFTVVRLQGSATSYVPAKARNYLFVVSINNYQHWPKLNNAVKDGRDLAQTLMAKYTFDSTSVTYLFNEQATRNNIYKQLRLYAETITPSDNLLIYFSGHGYFDPLLNEGYWIPVDATKGADGDYLPNSTILKILENVPTQHTLLIADACFSGSLFGDPRRGYAENVEKYRSRWGLASGRLEAVSDGSAGRNSPFATELIKFLSQNTKDRLTASELILAVKLGVPENAEQTPIGNPLKIEGDEGGEFVFYRRR
jgi:WD40 repeat protein